MPSDDAVSAVAGGDLDAAAPYDAVRRRPVVPADFDKEWHVELGRLVFDADCRSGGGESERQSVEKHLDQIRLTDEKIRRSHCYVMFMKESEKVLLYVEDPGMNVASYYVLTHRV